MHRVLLSFKSIEAKPEINKNNLKVSINYEENNVQRRLERILIAEDSVEKFVQAIIRDLRNDTKRKFASNSDDILDGFVNVVLDERDDGEVEEKLVNSLKRLRERVRGFKSIKSADGYMNKFFDMSKLEVKL